MLLLSQRRIADLVAYCLAYEFEDVVAAVTGAQRIDVTDLPGSGVLRTAYKLARLAIGLAHLARRLAPYPRSKVMLDRDFELFFPVFSHTYELYSLATIPDWRKRCRKAACFITEVWSDLLPDYLLELFSASTTSSSGSAIASEDVARITGRPCTYLPLAPTCCASRRLRSIGARPIHVCNIGRRSPITHQALDEARRGAAALLLLRHRGCERRRPAVDRTFRVDNPHEHRRMLATILKHSQLLLRQPQLCEQTRVYTADRDEISARFYEGAAAGTVMIGEAPRTDEFKQQFDWADARHSCAIRFPRYWPHPGGPGRRRRTVAGRSAQQCSGGSAQARLAASDSGRVRDAGPDAHRCDARPRQRLDQIALQALAAMTLVCWIAQP